MITFPIHPISLRLPGRSAARQQQQQQKLLRHQVKEMCVKPRVLLSRLQLNKNTQAGAGMHTLLTQILQVQWQRIDN